MIVPLVAGVILAVPFIFLARRHPAGKQLRPYAVGLLVAALIYVAFAGFRGNPGAIPLESSGVVLFGAAAFLGWRRWPVLLAVGWALHAGWDLWLPRPDPTYVPEWYPWLCTSFDLVVAGGVLLPRPSVVEA